MKKSEVLNKGYVHLVDHMGNDLTVVNAARVSFDKESEWGIDEEAANRLRKSGSFFRSDDVKQIVYGQNSKSFQRKMRS